MIIAFVGHGFLYNTDNLVAQIEKTINECLRNDEAVQFLCGGYGDFDKLCACTSRKMKNCIPSCELILVTPYIDLSRQERLQCSMDARLYDAVVYPPLERVPYKYAIVKRNEWMIDKADLIIAYVKHSYGGAYKSLVYAKRKKKRIINLAEL